VKHCTKCKQTLPLSEFNKDRGRKDGLTWYCKSCVATFQKGWRTRNPEQHKKLERKSYLKKRWGLSVEEYQKMSEAQDHKCAICQQVETENRSMAVDHDHKTGKIRGLLCRPCNTSLAQFENTDSLSRAVEYLNR
jgi:Recombination endonuclease VII